MPDSAAMAASPAMAAPRGVTVEAAALAAGFATALRRAGMGVSPERIGWLAEALRLVPPDSRDAVYRTCRATLVSTRGQLPIFDSVFAAVFDGLLDPSDTRGEQNAPPAVGSEQRTRATTPDSRPSAPAEHPATSTGSTPSPAAEGPEDEREPHREAPLAVASREERLKETSFAELSEDEIAQIRTLVRRIVLSTPVVRSRRSRASPHLGARLDLRRTIRSAGRTGSDAARLVYAHRRPRQRRLVLVCDVSGSMELYTRVFLSLLQGAVVTAGAEAFVFSTRLTRLTRQLKVRDPDQALARAAASTADWAGGTRLAESMRRFIDDHGRRGIARGAIVVVLSDGWALDPPEDVDAQMARLRRLAHRIIWVNPRKAAVGYRPVVGGMAAALPHCDAFVSGHDYAALAEVAAMIRADRIIDTGR